jgi:UDP-hydrolysing UDP-N-acetyl-D-glucosamine 2-epimerase
MKKKIAVFTANRAEYGLLLPVIKALGQRPEVELQLYVGGAHLDPFFGKTKDSIIDAGLSVTEEINISLADDNLFSTAIAIGQGIQEVAQALKKHAPDILVVYGDRFEVLSAAIAATQMRIPVAHLEGGDITEGGALDDTVRHAITKLVHLHLTTNEQARNNVLQLGEEAWRVHNVGLPSLDGIYAKEFATPKELQDKFNLDFHKPIILFTQHSVTTQFDRAREQIAASLAALEAFLNQEVQVFITYPNNDAGGKVVVEAIEDFRKRGFKNLIVIPALGAANYHGIMSLTQSSKVKVVCVGNSSSGIKETPIFGCPTVNIGSRQQGRLRAGNVIDVSYDTETITQAIKKCLYDETFIQHCAQVNNPYGDGTAGRKVADILSSISVDERLIAKKTVFKN